MRRDPCTCRLVPLVKSDSRWNAIAISNRLPPALICSSIISPTLDVEENLIDVVEVEFSEVIFNVNTVLDLLLFG